MSGGLLSVHRYKGCSIGLKYLSCLPFAEQPLEILKRHFTHLLMCVYFIKRKPLKTSPSN